MYFLTQHQQYFYYWRSVWGSTPPLCIGGTEDEMQMFNSRWIAS